MVKDSCKNGHPYLNEVKWGEGERGKVKVGDYFLNKKGARICKVCKTESAKLLARKRREGIKRDKVRWSGSKWFDLPSIEELLAGREKGKCLICKEVIISKAPNFPKTCATGDCKAKWKFVLTRDKWSKGKKWEAKMERLKERRKVGNVEGVKEVYWPWSNGEVEEDKKRVKAKVKVENKVAEVKIDREHLIDWGREDDE
jgi:hypothetical protein